MRNILSVFLIIIENQKSHPCSILFVFLTDPNQYIRNFGSVQNTNNIEQRWDFWFLIIIKNTDNMFLITKLLQFLLPSYFIFVLKIFVKHKIELHCKHIRILVICDHQNTRRLMICFP